jgi:hypothetical protein
VAPTLAVTLPRFLGIVEIDGEPQDLLLEDLAQAAQGDQVTGADDNQLDLARCSLVALQVPHWDDRELGRQRWLTQWTGRPMPALQGWFVKAWTLVEDRIGTGLKAAQRDVVTRFGRWLSDWAATAPEPFTLVHLDYRVDNFLFADDRICALDNTPVPPSRASLPSASGAGSCPSRGGQSGAPGCLVRGTPHRHPRRASGSLRDVRASECRKTGSVNSPGDGRPTGTLGPATTLEIGQARISTDDPDLTAKRHNSPRSVSRWSGSTSTTA